MTEMKIAYVTTDMLGKTFGVKGKELWVIRRKLARLGYIGMKPTSKGGRSYPLIRDLPLSATAVHGEYRAKFYTVGIDTAMEDAEQELESLAEEMRDWADNMDSGGLGCTDLYERVSETADTLEDVAPRLSDFDLPDILGGISVTAQPAYDTWLLQGRSRQLGRGRRLLNETAILSAVVDEAELWVKTDSEMKEFEDDEEAFAGMEEANRELEEWIEHIRGIIDELDGVDFPGMYG